MRSFSKIAVAFIATVVLFFQVNLVLAQTQPNSAGQVIVTTGPFQARGANQQSRPLTRGAYFYQGDILITGAAATAQVRFSDGTIMALSPNSQISVDQYSYQQNSSTDTSVVSLIKGGFRAVTGLISKENPSAYQVRTPVAVIGVRGTNYGASLDKGQLYAGVWMGGIYLKNNGGLIELGQGQTYNFAQVSSENTAPVGLLYPPHQLVGQCGA